MQFSKSQFHPQRVSSSLLDHGLPLALALADGEAVDLRLDLRPPLAHVVLNVEHKGVLAKVGVHNLAGCLQSHGGVQIGLWEGRGGQEGAGTLVTGRFITLVKFVFKRWWR